MADPERPVRLLLLVGRSTGGIGTHVAELAEHLRALGVSVRIATDDLTARRFGWADALQLWPAGGGPLVGARRMRDLRAWARHADIVHAHGLQAGIVAAAVAGPRSGAHRAQAGWGPRLVVSLHNEVPLLGGIRGRVAGGIESAALRRADLVTGASSDLVEAARALGAARAELALVPSPLVPTLLRATEADRREARRAIREGVDLPAGRPLVVTISRIAPQKDLATLIGAAARLRRQLDWIVAGSGVADLLTALRAEAEATRAPVRFVGAVDDPGRLLLAADVFVLTSTWEARALVVQEAMAAGTPVVATDVGGLPDLAAGVGLLVPPGDPAAVAEAVEGLVHDSARAAALAGQARARAATWPDG
ncbi:glycosyltransferase family 4 protein, partial [Nostocoides jenkinsii]|uniref:glycosyltransferase family 4 protein n=1 Tax=Nostocoides jenkinsii TaxID=330834 RepID=UPI00065B60B3